MILSQLKHKYRLDSLLSKGNQHRKGADFMENNTNNNDNSYSYSQNQPETKKDETVGSNSYYAGYNSLGSAESSQNASYGTGNQNVSAAGLNSAYGTGSQNVSSSDQNTAYGAAAQGAGTVGQGVSYGTGSQDSGISGQNTAYGTESQSSVYGAGGQNQVSYGAGSQNTSYASGNYYQNNAYQGNMNYQNIGGTQPQQQSQPGVQGKPKKEKKKRDKKPAGFGTKLAKCAALALVFGAVSGTVFEGVHFAGRQLAGETKTQSQDSDANTQGGVLSKSDQKVDATPVSSKYVATDVSDIVDSVRPSIVAITNVSRTEYQSFWGGMPQQYESTSCGSGIIVGQNDEYLYIATNNHVVEGAVSLTVTFDDSSTVSAEIKGTDPSTDLAVIKVRCDSIESDTLNTIKVATLGSSENLREGQAAIAIGNALGYGQSVTTGCISALNREVSVSDQASSTSYTAELIQTDAAINPGNSGGALLNAAGEVIGINSVKYSDTSVEGIGYAIPISTAIPIIEDLITKEKVDASDSAYLGVAGVDVTNDVSSSYQMPVGVYVAQVTAGSSAEQAGIQKGDIITNFDGRKVTTMEELASTIEYYKAGETVDVTLQRAIGGEYTEQVISVTLGKKN